MSSAHVNPPVSDPTQPARPDLSLGEVVAKLGDDLSGLLTTQIEIAKLEVKEEVTKAAKGAGFVTSGAFAAVVAVFMLSAAAAWAIAVPLNEWLGFLIVGALWAIAAAVLGVVGKNRLSAVNTVPEKTKSELEADRELAKKLP
ncbi:MAG: phage holin family protein [Ilumatobacter sp.]|uniref:phage holin family protein n=1 Tax=Ilumatobacter sp. TaxID=1967498 RepID=UPI003C71D34A